MMTAANLEQSMRESGVVKWVRTLAHADGDSYFLHHCSSTIDGHSVPWSISVEGRLERPDRPPSATNVPCFFNPGKWWWLRPAPTRGHVLWQGKVIVGAGGHSAIPVRLHDQGARSASHVT
jgi:hypothetical protein